MGDLSLSIYSAPKLKTDAEQDKAFQALRKELGAQREARGGKVIGTRGSDWFTNSKASGGRL